MTEFLFLGELTLDDFTLCQYNLHAYTNPTPNLYLYLYLLQCPNVLYLYLY